MIYSQVDSFQSNAQDSFIQAIDSIVAEMEAPFRNELTPENKNELAYFNELTETSKESDEQLLDSLLLSLHRSDHNLIMLDKLVRILEKQKNAVKLLLENMEINAFDPDASSSWNGTRYPCLDALKRSRAHNEIVMEILFTDFLHTYKITPRGLGDSLSYIVELIDKKPWTTELVELSLKYSTNKNKTMLLKEMLNRMTHR